MDFQHMYDALFAQKIILAGAAGLQKKMKQTLDNLRLLV